MKEALERPQTYDHEVNPAVLQQPAAGGATQDPAWAGSPETAGAKESVRRDAAGLAPEHLAELSQTLSTPTAAQLLEQSGDSAVGPELVAHVAADPGAAEMRERAIADAYGVVMAGGAAANGQPAAQSAIATAPAHMQQAAQNVAQEPGAGAPLPANVRKEMEAKFGEDFSSVQVHASSSDVAAMRAGAATRGDHIYFAPGKYDPESSEGKKLLAHELTHVIQQRGASPTGTPHVAASDSPAEQEAETAGAAVADGGEAKVARGSAPADAIHLGEAVVHQGIELEAAGVTSPGFNPKTMTPQQRAALEMYSGNFMRDYSQLAAPMPLKALSNIPSTNKGGKTGPAGARVLMDALVKTIGILELGKDVANATIKQSNIGSYEAEHHIDNPIGTSASGDFITEGPNPHAAVAPQAKAIRTVDALGSPVTAPNSSTDADTQQTHAGSAMPGLQFENPELYKVGDGGIANHIANSTEHAKNCLLEASAQGPSPTGRMKLGMAQHIVEDYFSHSNFIEVALNQYINDAVKSRKAGKAKPGRGNEKTDAFIDEFADKQGNVEKDAVSGQKGGAVRAEFAFVDTLYDAKTKDGKQAITTGTFGGGDTKVSLGHALLPKLPKIEHTLHTGVDETFGVIEKAAKEKKPPTWEYIKQALDTKGNVGAATEVMLEATKTAGIGVPCPVGFHVEHRDVKLPLFGTTSVPKGIALDWSAIPIADALVTGGGTYVAVMEKLDEIKKAAGLIGLQDVIEAIQAQIRAAMNKMMQAIRQQITQMLRGIIADLAGEGMDPDKLAHAGIDELSELAEHKMHEKTEQTSIQSRMERTDGDLHKLTLQGTKGKAELERRVGPVVAKFPDKGNPGSEANPWVTRDPLPPSHSEISKDHPPHHHADPKHWHAEGPEKTKVKANVSDKVHDGHKHAAGETDHDGDPGHTDDEHEHEDLGDGSSFYGLHRALAVEADRHIMKQIEVVWKASLIPGQKIDESKMTIAHEEMLGEARGVAGNAAKDAKADGMRFAQTDTRIPEKLRSNGDVMTLLDLVDYFVSHPSASKWWETIFNQYIAEHGEEVHKSILARNHTRGRRH